ncbi:5-dehydro-4-deoxy-D-glucuronate isomerase [Martelella sp. HB161492]|uniref:5-dehydro-4-deoxy-D-glucuronate isomerase n=1 Tax=Martelella sp. HB161492 TaxID=2720726 RepID=UPI0015901882|nr:5-dehydro-4-deoxy-D-glucuronate isomerase [Martelella sp. HB161492]
MLNIEIRHAIDPVTASTFGTEELRDHFRVSDIFVDGEINLIYTHYDRMIVGGAVPGDAELELDHVAPCGTASILDRREITIVNVGGPGKVVADAEYDMVKGDMLYLGMGAGKITFSGEGRFYILSAPAHQTYPSRLIKIAEAANVTLGSKETCNERTIYQFVHPDVMKSCQLVVGMTKLAAGSIWNTMPAHVHDRRMEAYLYVDVPDGQRVFHMMGEPDETRHLVLKNEEGAISPPWSIHAGAGTASYTFIWAMAGDNVDYKDVEMVSMETLK